MVVFSKHIPQQAVFSPKPLAEVKETSNLGEVRLLEQNVWVVIPKVTPAFNLGKVKSEKEAEEILRKLIQHLRQALRQRKDLVVLSIQQPKHPPSHHTNRPMEYFKGMPAIPLNHKSAVEEGIKLAERLNQERLGGQGKILGVHKSVEGGDYVIWMEVPLEIYKDLDLTTEIGVEVLKLSDRLGVPFFLYFVPPGYSHYFG
jgi:hypothetical protein